jgi:NAD(P)H dehydrogenase (quinone)
MIAITGANGQLGRLVIASLLEKTDAANIVALVRNPDSAADLKALGVEVRQADYNKPETLVNAFVGIDKLLLISGSEIGSRVRQHQAVIDAVKDKGLALFAYTSILQADTSPMILAQEHKATEQAINDAGLPAVILRNGWYSENYTQSMAGVLEAGMVAGAAKEGKLHTAARQDYAEAAAIVLISEQSQVGKVYELAGDEGFTLAEYAAEIAKQSGKNIQFQSMSGADFASLLVKVGLPKAFADVLADSEICAADGWLADDSKTLSQLIGRNTTTLADSISVVV